jgi:hypothetical protein
VLLAADHFPSPLEPKKKQLTSSNKVLSVADHHATATFKPETKMAILKAIEEREDDPATIGSNIMAGIPPSKVESYQVNKTTSQFLLGGGGHR